MVKCRHLTVVRGLRCGGGHRCLGRAAQLECGTIDHWTTAKHRHHYGHFCIMSSTAATAEAWQAKRTQAHGGDFLLSGRSCSNLSTIDSSPLHNWGDQ